MGRPKFAPDEKTARSFASYLAALQSRHGIWIGSWIQPRLRECCDLTGLSYRKVTNLFAFYEMVPKQPIRNSEVVERVGPLDDLYGDPEVATMVQQMNERRHRVREAHLREWNKALEKRSKRRKPKWDDRLKGETLEEYRLRLEAGDPIEREKQLARMRKIRARRAAREAK